MNDEQNEVRDETDADSTEPNANDGELLNLPDPGDTAGVKLRDVLSVMAVRFDPNTTYLMIVTRHGAKYAPDTGPNKLRLAELNLAVARPWPFTRRDAEDAVAFLEALGPIALDPEEPENVADQVAWPTVDLLRDPNDDQLYWIAVVSEGKLHLFEGTDASIALFEQALGIRIQMKTHRELKSTLGKKRL